MLQVNQAHGKNISFSLEALRGYASVFVIWHHVQVFGYWLDPKYVLSGPLAYGPSGHFCVLLFFVLSGYVIGLANKKPLEWGSVGLYLKKRIVRLYPVFFLTLLFMLLVNPNWFSTAAIAGNFAILQSVLSVDINPPSWSLHYEVLYYLLFIFISVFRFNPLLCAGGALLIGLGNNLLFSASQIPIISSYCYGMVFWLLGLAMSKYLRNAEQEPLNVRVLLSGLFLILCIDQYNTIGTLLQKTINVLHLKLQFPGHYRWSQLAIPFMDLAYLPYALLIVLLFTGKQFPHKMKLLWGIIGLDALTFVYLAKQEYQGDLNWSEFALPTVLFIASWLVLLIRSAWLERVGKVLILQVGTWLGSLSYGIYLVHVPLLLLFSRITLFAGTPLTFAIRFALFLLATLASSYFLERILQPRIKDFFFKPASEEVLAEIKH